MPDKFLIVIGGPTGVGKTQAAIDLAIRYHTAVVNADSRQIYAELNIGVGRPSLAQLEATPHHLIGFTSIHQPYSVGQYLNDALTVINELFLTHDVVILSGGTGLYIKAIMTGLDAFPEVPDSVVQKWDHHWKTYGTASLAELVKEKDPDYYAMVDRKNHMRLLRALAVMEVSGLPFSSFRKGESTEHPFQIIPIVLELPREELYQRINLRVESMIAQGWLDEAKTLYPFRSLKALNTVGYAELFQVLDGTLSLEASIPLIQQSTRHYAKRQLTWWRNQGDWRKYSPHDISSIIKELDGLFVQPLHG